jgi:hypothetical protein
MITAKINCSKIDKSALFEGKNGKYCDFVLFENRDGTDQYGNDGFVTQDIGKERRLAGERGPIIGNWKNIGTKGNPPTSAPSVPSAGRYENAAEMGASIDDQSDIPF